jgi:hypothetical protein
VYRRRVREGLPAPLALRAPRACARFRIELSLFFESAFFFEQSSADPAFFKWAMRKPVHIY